MAEEMISRLKKKRGILRTSVTKHLKIIENELSQETTLDILEESLEMLNEYSKDLELLDSELEKIIDSKELDADLITASEYREKIMSWKFKAKKKINILSKPITNEVSSEFNLKDTKLESLFQEKFQIKLPKLSINKFYGKISQWLTFWNSFESAIHNNTSLDKISKFNYLKAYLGGTALQTIEGFAITAENYDSAVKMLENRFGRKEVLINVHMSNILNIPPLKSSRDVKSFRKFYDILQTEIRSLSTLEVTSDSYSSILCPMLLKILPADLIFEFNKEVQNSDYKIEDLTDFLSKQLIARERSCLSAMTGESEKISFPPLSRSNVRYDEKYIKRKSTSSDLLISQSKSKQAECVFCSQCHDSYNCEYANKLSLDERKSILLKKAACFKCFKVGHLSKYCRIKVSCKLCGKNHTSIMCFYHKNKGEIKSHRKGENKESDDNVLTNNACSKEVLLQTLIVRVNGSMLRLIIDTGSQKSYITKYAAKALKLKCIGEELVTHGLFGGVQKVEKHNKYALKLSNIDQSFNFELEVMDQETICTTIPKLKNVKSISNLKELGIFLSDIAINEYCCLYQNNPNEIQILLGADYACKLFTGEIKNLKDGLLAMNTKLGWTVLGKSEEKEAKNSNVLLSLHVSCFDISEYWSLDTIGIRDPDLGKSRLELEKATKDHFLRTITRDEEGRYVVSLPWIADHPPLQNCRNISEKRLANCVKSLEKVGRLHEYEQVFKDWLSQGIIEETLPAEKIENEHFLPHRPIFKDNSTTKVRPVFDGSVKVRNFPSLNDCVEKGPNLIELIPTLTNKFRLKRYGVIADIEKAFLQISLQPKDRPFLKFLWWEKGDKERLQIFQHKRVVFGISSSPFLLAATLEYHLDERRVPAQFQETAHKLRSAFYVDNCVLSLDAAEEVTNFISEAQALLSTAKFHLRGWEHTSIPSMLDKSKEERTIPVLGLNWKLPNDVLIIDMKSFSKEEDPPLTKRKMLSATHRIFDPIGFSCPITLIPKLLLQECWRNGISWDAELPLAIVKKFERWKKELEILKELEIPRHLLQDSLPDSDLSIHVFCDASKSAYATCIFLRVKDEHKVTCQLVQARCRVAPVKTISIPRLELLACTIGVRLAHNTLIEMGWENLPITYWTDSANALYWIKGTDNWATFVYNRVQEIRLLSDPDDWKHICGQFNPADLPSRGCNSNELLKTRWWEGPIWLKSTPDEWPISNIDPDIEIVNSEKRKTIVSAINSACDVIEYANKISSYSKIIRIMAWVRRFCFNCKNKCNRKTNHLKVDEINQAENFIFKKVQEQTIENKQISNLTTFTAADGIIRVKTRIAMRKDLEAFRYPILLPSKHDIVDKLIFEKHIEHGHCGLQNLISILREEFWIIKSRKTIRQVLRKCVKCKKFDSHSIEIISPPITRRSCQGCSSF